MSDNDTPATSKDVAREMIDAMFDMIGNLEKWIEKDTKAAAKRARAGTLKFGKMAKVFRKWSVQESNKAQG